MLLPFEKTMMLAVSFQAWRTVSETDILVITISPLSGNRSSSLLQDDKANKKQMAMRVSDNSIVELFMINEVLLFP